MTFEPPADFEPVPFSTIVEIGNALGLILKYGTNIRFMPDADLIRESEIYTAVFGLGIPGLVIDHTNVVKKIRELEPNINDEYLAWLRKRMEKASRQMGVKP